jgi:DNA segregation ATPase FtsK/SpoIIIE-like protein
MLCMMPGSGDLEREHCAYISEEEVMAVCDFLRAQGQPVYDEHILTPSVATENDNAAPPKPRRRRSKSSTSTAD